MQLRDLSHVLPACGPVVRVESALEGPLARVLLRGAPTTEADVQLVPHQHPTS